MGILAKMRKDLEKHLGTLRDQMRMILMSMSQPLGHHRSKIKLRFQRELNPNGALVMILERLLVEMQVQMLLMSPTQSKGLLLRGKTELMWRESNPSYLYHHKHAMCAVPMSLHKPPGRSISPKGHNRRSHHVRSVGLASRNLCRTKSV